MKFSLPLRKVKELASPAEEEVTRPVYVSIVTSNRKSVFEITEEGAREAQHLPETGATVFLIDGNPQSKDVRVVLPKPMRDRAAKEHVYESLDEPSRMLRLPADPRIVYARDLLSLDAYDGHNVIPAALLIDHILGSQLEFPTVFPILLRDQSGKLATLILYGVKIDEETGATQIGPVQVTWKPDSEIHEYVTSFASKNKISIEGREESITGPTDAELFRIARELPCYPHENDLFGLPVSRVYRGMAIGAAGIAALGLLGNLYLGVEAGYLSVSAALAERERDELAHSVSKMLTDDIRAFARGISIDEKFAIKSAQDIWQPNSLTKIGCVPTKCTIDLIGGIERSDGSKLSQGSSQLLSNVVDEEMVRNILLQQAPDGFRKQNIAISGDANVITITFEHQKASSPVFGLLPR